MLGKLLLPSHVALSLLKVLYFTSPQHWSNGQETLKLINEVVNLYVVKKRSDIKLAETQKALMVQDVFNGQKTEAVEQ